MVAAVVAAGVGKGTETVVVLAKEGMVAAERNENESAHAAAAAAPAAAADDDDDDDDDSGMMAVVERTAKAPEDPIQSASFVVFGNVEVDTTVGASSMTRLVVRGGDVAGIHDEKHCLHLPPS